MFRSMLVGAGLLLAVGLVAAPAAFAQRDAGAKIRGEYGTRYSTPSRSRSVSAQSYQYSAPLYVRSVGPSVVTRSPANAEVAQGPVQRRAFSMDPSVESESAVGMGPAARYYEPAPRSYSVPQRRSSRTPAYLLQKTDSRRYGG